MTDLSSAKWINPPLAVSGEGGTLRVTSGRDTDYWNNTFYGFRHGNGHFLAAEASGDFSLTVKFSAPYTRLYDQAGAMIRVDDENWMKCGVEFTDGAKQFSVVVTRDDQSDWSVMPLDGALGAPVTLRVARHGEALRVEVEEGGNFRLVRLAFLRMGASVQAGPMCCSPTGEGLEVTFHSVAFGPAISRELHA